MLELEDHIGCEPGCEERLGDPGALAATFAEELATARARRSAFHAFWALALVAVAMALSQLVIGQAGGYPGFDHGLTLALFVPAFIGLFIAPQVALVAGTLAGWRAFRRRRTQSLPAAEIGLIERRTRVALVAGFAGLGGLALYLVDFVTIFPAWYLMLVGGSALLAGTVMYASYTGLVRARGIVSACPGPAGDVYDDLPLPRWLRHRPWRLGAIGALAVAVVSTVGLGHAERSLSEGLQRGVLEGVAAFIGYVVLGKAIGLLASRAASASASGSRARR